MKHLIIFIIIAFSIPCSAQWSNASYGGQVLTFGVHDTSLFISINPGGNPDPIVWRLISLKPDVIWQIADTGINPTQGNVTSFASLGNYFFAGMTETSNGSIGPLYRSTNGGSSWAYANAGGPAFTNGEYLFGNGLSSGYRSSDSGRLWQNISCPEAISYTSIGICIFANTGTEILRSYDTGNIWSQISHPLTGTITPMGTLLFIPGNGELAVSTDSGSQWTTIPVDSAGVPENVNCLATDGKNLFAGTTIGVLVSTDAGQHWITKNDSMYEGHISPNTTQMAVLDTFLFTEVTYGTGKYYVFYSPISELTKTDSPLSVVQSSPLNDSIEVYPNPAAGIVTILSGGTSILGVSVLNVLGENVLDLPNLRQSDITLDISKLPSGTYFLQIQTEEGNVIRKIVKEE